MTKSNKIYQKYFPVNKLSNNFVMDSNSSNKDRKFQELRKRLFLNQIMSDNQKRKIKETLKVPTKNKKP